MTRILSLSHQDQERISQLEEWLNSIPDDELTDVRPASSDASFRRYFRVTGENTGRTFIVMDAPPDKEDCRPFIHITELLRSVDVNAPAIITMDLEKGFLLLDDLGDRQYLDHLDQQNSGRLYNDALESLVNMQRIKDDLPSYNDQKLLDEMGLFEPWYLNRHLRIELDAAQKSTLDAVFQLLIDSALEQPRVFVHRDYHSRNLMLVDDNNPGVIDYQDAVMHGSADQRVKLLTKRIAANYTQPKTVTDRLWPADEICDVIEKGSLDLEFRCMLIRAHGR